MSTWKPTYAVTGSPSTMPGGYQVAEIAYSAPTGQLYLPSVTLGEVGVGTELYLLDPSSLIESLDVFPNTADSGFTINGGMSITITKPNTPYIFKYAGSGSWSVVTGPPPSSITSGCFGITIDGGGSAITTGVKGYIQIPYDCTITGWTVLLDQSGSIVVDVWKDTLANYPPTVIDSIAGTEKPTVTLSTYDQDLSLTSWTTAVTSGDVIAFNVDSASVVTRATVQIFATRI